MAKYYGAVGYAIMNSSDGVWTEEITERCYCGDSIRINRRLQPSDKLNDDINVGNQISIVSDPFALQNFASIRYATFMGIKWKVTDVDVQYPRLILTLGGVYNGPAGPSTNA